MSRLLPHSPRGDGYLFGKAQGYYYFSHFPSLFVAIEDDDQSVSARTGYGKFKFRYAAEAGWLP